MKAAIVDLKGKYAAALTENGEVKRLFNNSYEIGQEIELYDTKEVRQPRSVPRVIRRVAAVAAAIIILLVGSIGTAYAIPCGTVSLDSDPSIEYTVNCFDYVLDVRALNEDGETVIEEIGVSNLKHHKIGDAVTTTVEQMKDDGFFEDENKGVSITANTGNDQHSENLQQDLENRVFNDMGIPQQTREQTTEKDPQTPDNDTPADNTPADDGQQKQEQEQAPNQNQDQNQDQPENDSHQNAAGQNDSPQDQNGGNVSSQNSGQNQVNGNQPQTQPERSMKR